MPDPSPRPILIDTDTGVDDAMAIALALNSPECRVVALTTVAGNAEVEKCTRNARTIVKRVAPAQPPLVAQGARRPLRLPLVTAPEVHGRDGLGNTQRPTPPARMTSTAVGTILDSCRRYGKHLTIVAIGPLTNLALALRRDARLLRTAGRIVSMGGAFRVPGNTGPVAEFNYFVDPDAAELVLNGHLPVTVIPLDVTEQCVLLADELRHVARRRANPLGSWFVRVTSFYMRYHRKTEGFEGGYLHDPLAVAVAIDPTFVTTLRAEVHVECRSPLTRGMTVSNFSLPARRVPSHVEVAVAVDRQRFLTFFFERIF